MSISVENVKNSNNDKTFIDYENISNTNFESEICQSLNFDGFVEICEKIIKQNTKKKIIKNKLIPIKPYINFELLKKIKLKKQAF